MPWAVNIFFKIDALTLQIPKAKTINRFLTKWKIEMFEVRQVVLVFPIIIGIG